MSSPGYQAPPRDPTAVMGRRIGAYLVDALLALLLFAFLGATPLNPQAEYVEIPDGFDMGDICEQLRDNNDDIGRCQELFGRAYFIEDDNLAIPAAAGIAWFVLIQLLWQGLAGLSPGKLLFGVRVVGEDGRAPGIGRAFIRSILWIVDAAPYCFPLVGLITGLSTKGHRRVGDMAAKTYVIGKADTGRPVVLPGATAGYGGPPGYPGGYPPAGYGTPTTYAGTAGYPSTPSPGPWGAAPPSAAPAPPTAAPTAPATPSAFESPEAGTPAASDAPASESSESTAAASGEVEAAPADAPAQPATESAPASTPAPASTAAAAPRTEYNPQWDAARGTYIQWDANRSRWLAWDDAAKQWKPI